MKKPIAIKTAKDELARINGALKSPHLLIGGLAVQQYHTTRVSKDIDLICDFEPVQELLESLYPSKDWNIEDKTADEYRPSYRITRKYKLDEIGEIIFGPKIGERGSYEYLDWEMLEQGARPFKHAQGQLNNIRVPAPHALAYSKLVSFVARVDANPKKGIQDLRDFAGVTNHAEFLSESLYRLIRDSGKDRQLIDDFRVRSAPYEAELAGSHLHELAFLFPNPEWASKHSQPVHIDVGSHHLEGYWTSEWVYGQTICEDLLHIAQIERQNVLGRRSAQTGDFSHWYQVTGICAGERLHLIARPRSASKSFAVSLVLETKDRFGEELEGLAIRPAGNEMPDPPISESLFSMKENFWASKVIYRRAREPQERRQLWDLLSRVAL